MISQSAETTKEIVENMSDVCQLCGLALVFAQS